MEAIAGIAPDVLLYEEKLRRINLKAGIEWSYREKLRAAQGHFSKIDDLLNDLMWSIGTDPAVKIIEEVWGPIEAEE
jgi:hypothetical protein